MSMTRESEAASLSLTIPGVTWARLSAERLDTCQALLDLPPVITSGKTEGTREVRAEGSNRKRVEALEARLGQIDRAMDSLMEGRYGLCKECGGPIERAWLSADPAAALCSSDFRERFKIGSA